MKRIKNIVDEKKKRLKEKISQKTRQDRAKELMPCTFKPKINETGVGRRTVYDLYRWKQESDLKKLEKEFEYQEEYRKKHKQFTAGKRSKKLVNSDGVKVEERLIGFNKKKEDNKKQLEKDLVKGLFQPRKFRKKSIKQIRKSAKDREFLRPSEIVEGLCDSPGKETRDKECLRVKKFNTPKKKFEKKGVDFYEGYSKARTTTGKRVIYEYDKRTGLRVPAFSERRYVADEFLDKKQGRKRTKRDSRKRISYRSKGKASKKNLRKSTQKVERKGDKTKGRSSVGRKQVDQSIDNKILDSRFFEEEGSIQNTPRGGEDGSIKLQVNVDVLSISDHTQNTKSARSKKREKKEVKSIQESPDNYEIEILNELIPEHTTTKKSPRKDQSRSRKSRQSKRSRPSRKSRQSKNSRQSRKPRNSKKTRQSVPKGRKKDHRVCSKQSDFMSNDDTHDFEKGVESIQSIIIDTSNPGYTEKDGKLYYEEKTEDKEMAEAIEVEAIVMDNIDSDDDEEDEGEIQVQILHDDEEDYVDKTADELQQILNPDNKKFDLFESSGENRQYSKIESLHSGRSHPNDPEFGDNKDILYQFHSIQKKFLGPKKRKKKSKSRGKKRNGKKRRNSKKKRLSKNRPGGVFSMIEESISPIRNKKIIFSKVTSSKQDTTSTNPNTVRSSHKQMDRFHGKNDSPSPSPDKGSLMVENMKRLRNSLKKFKNSPSKTKMARVARKLKGHYNSPVKQRERNDNQERSSSRKKDYYNDDYDPNEQEDIINRRVARSRDRRMKKRLDDVFRKDFQKVVKKIEDGEERRKAKLGGLGLEKGKLGGALKVNVGHFYYDGDEEED